MSGRKKAVPWLNWAEWQDVRVGFFSSDLYEKQRSVSRVASWRSRAQLPVAINATAQLIELALHESMAQHHNHAIGVSSRSHMELSLLYSNSIVRCVNGLVDGSQKGAYAMAISTLAQRIGIPLWIVDLRHESTHNQLPSLPVLRFAARHLLAWLEVNYWKAQEDLIRRQVHCVSQWLFEQMPHLNRQPFDNEVQMDSTQADDTQMQINFKARMDVDALQNVVVPLMVDGRDQFGQPVTPTGLLFLEAPPLPEDQGLRNTTTIFQRDSFITLLRQLQPLWRGFSASLLARLCQKIFNVLYPQKSCCKSEEGEKLSAHDEQTEHTCEQSEVEMTLQWIKFMVSSEYRERVKLQIGPIEDMCLCGAQMLALAENIKPEDVAGGRAELLEHLVAVLRFSKAVRNHPTLAIEAAISTSLASESAKGWTQLPAWVESPIGLRYCYRSCRSYDQSQVLEFSLDDDSLMPDSTTFVAFEDEEEEGVNKTDADDVMDALIEDLDAVYDATLQHILDLQAMVTRDGLRQGGSTMVVRKQELQRIQEEIEIW